MAQRVLLALAVVLAAGHVWLRGGFVGLSAGSHAASAPAVVPPGMARAVFAGGCFWSMEAAFDELDGVVTTTSGYTGGHVPEPTYEQVLRGETGHVEAVEVVYDPARLSYDRLLDHYWHNVDPFVEHRQFCDAGPSYRPGVFVASPAERTAAESSRAALQGRFGRTIVVPVLDAAAFYPAEAYHQDYHTVYAAQYRYYRWACRRDQRLREIWGDS